MGQSMTKEQRLRDAEKDILMFGAKWCASEINRRDRKMTASYRFDDVPTTQNRTMHTVQCEIASESDDISVEFKETKNNVSREPLVLLHGYGGGVGNFYAVMPLIAERWSSKVFALDCFGCGISSRPSCSTIDRVKMETLMVEELEMWRKSMGIEKFSLLGHSIGGYIAACYAEKYPSRVEVLFLASPAGIPDEPKNWQESLKSKMGMKATVVLYLWRQGWSPFTAVRAADYVGKGKGLIKKYVARRYEKNVSWACPQLLVEYIHANFSRSPSAGDYTHAAFLKPGAWAKSPLNVRIPKMKISKVVFLYGDHDWMNPKHARDLRDHMSNNGTLKRMSVEIRQVQNAGHNLQVDNPIGFVHNFFDALRGVES